MRWLDATCSWVWASASVRALLLPSPSAVCFGQGRAGGFCHASIPGICFWVKVSPGCQGYSFGRKFAQVAASGFECVGWGVFRGEMLRWRQTPSLIISSLFSDQLLSSDQPILGLAVNLTSGFIESLFALCKVEMLKSFSLVLECGCECYHIFVCQVPTREGPCSFVNLTFLWGQLLESKSGFSGEG